MRIFRFVLIYFSSNEDERLIIHDLGLFIRFESEMDGNDVVVEGVGSWHLMVVCGSIRR